MTILLALALLQDARADVLSRLDRRLSIDVKDAPLADALAFVREATGLQFHLESDAAPRVSLTARDVPVRTALKLMLRRADLGVVYRDGVLVVGAAGRAARTAELHDVRALLLAAKDFPGPRLELGGARGARIGCCEGARQGGCCFGL